MKIRLRNDSVRFRLTQKEVAALAAGSEVTSATHISPSHRLTFSLCGWTGEAILANSLDDGVCVLVPAGQLDDWCNSDEVSLQASQHVSGDVALELLIEKDFACLAPRAGDDDEDCFPHPRGAASASA